MVTVCRYVYSSRSFTVSVSRCATSLARFGGGSSGPAARAAVARSTDVRMSAMANTSGGFRAALFAGWMALCLIGLWYARWKGIPSWAALPALAAFLVEYPFYLVPAFPSIREKLAGERLPAFLVASAVLPYLACSLGATQFQWTSLVKLTALALSLALWYRVFPPAPIADIGFLALVVAVKIGRFAAPIYPTAYRGVEIAVLGDLAL